MSVDGETTISSVATPADTSESMLRAPSIIMIPSSNIIEDSETFLQMLPHNFYNENLQHENSDNVQVIRSRLSDEEVILFFDEPNSISTSGSSHEKSAPNTCLVVTKTELEYIAQIREQLSNISIKVESTIMGIQSVLVRMPGGSSIFFVSKSNGSTTSLVQHLLQQHAFDQIPKAIHPESKIPKNLHKISTAATRNDHKPPVFPSISVNVIQQEHGIQRLIPMIPNTINGQDIESDLLTGKLMLILRPENPNDDIYHYEQIFKGKRRRFELQLQFQLKKLPNGILYCGGEVDGHMKLGLIPKGVSNLLLNLLSKLTRHMYYSFGSKDGSENAKIVFPLWTFCDRLIVTKPGEKPPELGKLLYEPKDSVNARKASNSTGVWDLNNIYTISFNSSNVDFPTWNVVNVPLVPDTDLHMFWRDSPLKIVLYDVSNQVEGTKHLNSLVNYALNIQIIHNVSDSKQGVELFDFEDEGLEKSESSGMLQLLNTKTSKYREEGGEEIQKNKEKEDLSMFFDALETESHVQFEDEHHDAMCSAYIDMYQAKDKKYETLFAFVVNGTMVFHDFAGFTKHFKVKHEPSHQPYSKYSRLSGLEQKRRFMASYIGFLLLQKKDTDLQKTTNFFQSSSSYGSGFLQHSRLPSSLANLQPKMYACVARARSEYHWIEEWVLLTNHHLYFFYSHHKKPRYRIPIRAILRVRKLNMSETPNLPNYNFIAIETFGRTIYVMMSSKDLVDKWVEGISSVLAQNLKYNLSERFTYDPSDEFLHKSSMWKCKKRRILNCKRFVFHPFSRNGLKNKDPCTLAESILHKALTMSESSDEQIMDLLNSVAEFKAVDVSILDEKDRLTFFLNLYHIMVMHAMIVISPPTSGFKFASFFNTVSYQCSDDIFSIAELEHCIIRNKMSSPSHFISKWIIPKSVYSFSLNTSDSRINFALNCGSKSNPRHVPVYKRSELDDQLKRAVRVFLDETVEVIVKKNGGCVIDIPKVCDWYMNDFGCKKGSDLLNVLRPYFREDLRNIVGKEYAGNYSKSGEGEIVVRFLPFDFDCHELSLHELKDRGF